MITMQVLTSDLTKTKKIHIFKEQLLEAAKINGKAASTLEDKIRFEKDSEVAKELKLQQAEHLKANGEALEMVGIYEENPIGPVFEIRFLPPELKTDLDLQRTAALSGTDNRKGFTIESMRALNDVTKQEVKWGIAGIEQVDGVEFAFEKGKYEGVEYPLLDREGMRFIERNNWIILLRELIMKYNNMGIEKKTP